MARCRTCSKTFELSNMGVGAIKSHTDGKKTEVFFSNSKLYLKNMQVSLQHHMYKCITWLFTYFPFNTLILQLNTHTPTEKKKQEKHTVRSILSSTWSPSVGIYDGALVKVNARSYVQAFSQIPHIVTYHLAKRALRHN